MSLMMLLYFLMILINDLMPWKTSNVLTLINQVPDLTNVLASQQANCAPIPFLSMVAYHSVSVANRPPSSRFYDHFSSSKTSGTCLTLDWMNECKYLGAAQYKQLGHQTTQWFCSFNWRIPKSSTKFSLRINSLLLPDKLVYL